MIFVAFGVFVIIFFFDLIRDHLMISLVIFQQRRAYCEYCIPFLQVSLPAVCVVVC